MSAFIDCLAMTRINHRTKMPRVSEQTRVILNVWTIHRRSHKVAGTPDSCFGGLGFCSID